MSNTKTRKQLIIKRILLLFFFSSIYNIAFTIANYFINYNTIYYIYSTKLLKILFLRKTPSNLYKIRLSAHI